MARYHINPETGSAGRCKAEHFCPFGSMTDDHYDSMAEARKAFESKQESFARLEPEAKVKLLSRKVRRRENIDYDYIGKAFEYIRDWEEPWTSVEEDNFDKLVELNGILERKPFTEHDRAEAEALIDSLTPHKERHRSAIGWSSSDTSWRARDKTINLLARYLLVRRLGDEMTFDEVEPVTNERLIGLEAAQEAALEQFNYHGLEEKHPPYAGEVEPYLQESIARTVRGDALPEFATDQEDRTLLPKRARLHFSMDPDSPAYNQSLYLATVFPVKELKEEMENVGVSNVSVSVLRNGREHGNVYSVIQPDGKVRAFAVYEHRNSDSIIINGKEGWDGKDLPYVGDSKNRFYGEFSVGENRQAARALAFFMKSAQRGELESDDELDHKAPRLDWGNILSNQIPGFKEWAEKRGEVITKPEDESDDDVIKRLDF